MSDLKKYKILVADDNKINVKVAEYTLRNFASQLDFAYNGVEVLEKIDKNTYDVILMDVKMPVMDGYEATQIIRSREKENPNLKAIKIIAITANNQPEEITFCMSVGMDDFLAKPFTSVEAFSRIQSLCDSNL